MTEQTYPQMSADHDLLIRIDEKLEIALRSGKDHEVRIRRLELWGALFVGGLYVINTALGLYIMYISQHYP